MWKTVDSLFSLQLDKWNAVKAWLLFVLLLFTLQEKPEEANVERAEVPADLAASPGSALH